MGIDVRVEPRGYEIEFVPLGCIPSPLQYKRRSKRPAKCFLLAEEERERSVERHLVGGLLQRYLLRGVNIPPTPAVEELALQRSGVAAECEKSEGEEEKYNVLEERRPDLQRIGKRLAQLNYTEIPMLEKSLQDGEEKLLDSWVEEKFLKEWVLENLQEQAAYIFPQYYIRNLTGELGEERRVDFLYYDGAGREAIAIELDGAEHYAGREVDREREQTLAEKGVRTIRVPNSEVKEGKGEQLDKLIRAIRSKGADMKEIPGDSAPAWAKAVLCCDEGLSMQYALTRMLQKGKTGGENMVVEVGGCTEIEVIEAAVRDWAELGRAICQIHGIGEGSGVPDGIEVRETAGSPIGDEKQTVRIIFERIPAWWHRIPEGQPDVIIRPAEFPVEPAVEILLPRIRTWKERRLGSQDIRAQKAGLRTFLRDAFRKRDFREAQEEAILRCIAGKDTVVLLPTGAGKSLIYQMASLVRPGLTLVVAPLVALIEDQIERLKGMGIDRVVGIAGRQSKEKEQQAQEQLRGGSALILIVAPERLLMPKFRQTIGVLNEVEGVELVVIDEAHCVSEWGHDFRPAYLQVGRILKEILGQPPLLALTGTASLAVYRDMMAHLEIAQSDEGAAIRPSTHNRPEIKMELRYRRSKREASTAREAMLEKLPGRFGMQRNRFWEEKGKRTMCGIMFMPTVKGKDNGIEKGVELVRRAGARSVVTYAGSGSHAKNRAESAWKFERNQANAMTATNAFGMGIDKPNVRWVAHPHLTMSLEGYFQQIGRAGRDGQEAWAVAVMHEEDTVMADSVLDPRKEWKEAKKVYDSKRWWDDVGTALYFHFQAFQGVDQEKLSLRETIENLELGKGLGERILSFGTGDGKERERDIGRLSRLGIVADYEVDYGAKRFTLVIGNWDPHELGARLSEYVSRFDRAQAASVEEDLLGRLREAGERPEAQAIAAAAALVDYLYSSVERARRRAIQETVKMARTCENDQQIRQFMLNYLSEGKGLEVLEELLDAPRIDWDAFRRFFDDVESGGQAEAGRLLGMFGRALESRPEHPALLVCRATVEAIRDDGEPEMVEQNVRAALKSLPKYVASSELDFELGRMEEFIRRAGERTGGKITREVQWLYWQPLEDLCAHEQAFAEKVQQWGARPHERELANLFHVRDAIHRLGEIMTVWADITDLVEGKQESVRMPVTKGD